MRTTLWICWSLVALAALAAAAMGAVTVGAPNSAGDEAHPPAAEPAPPPLPIPVPLKDWEPLYEHVDPALQGALEAALKARPGWAQLVRRKKLAIGVVDLTDPSEPRFARVNGNAMMYAASMPKVAVLLTAYVAFDDGSLEETEEVRADLAAMIRTSSNAAATRMIDRLGFDKIESVLRDPRFKLFDEKRGGGLWVGKRYAKTGGRHPDPIQGLSHGATVTQVCRLYYMLATGRVINAQRSLEMLGDLSDPKLHHKFVHELELRAPKAKLFRKSGTWRDWHSDSVLVWGPHWRRYILVAMVESPDGESILRDMVPAIEPLLEPRAQPAPDRGAR